MATRRGPDNSIRFSIGGTINNVTWANVFWAQCTTSGAPSQSDLDTWLTTVSNAYKTRFASHEGTIVTYTQAQALFFLPGGLSLPSLIAMTGAGTGTFASTATQAECAILSWTTGVYWRGGKPRTYLPCPPAADVGSSKALLAAAQTALATAANGFRTDVGGTTSGAITASQLGFVSFRSGNADRVPPVFYAYTGAKVHPRLGTQRRRVGKWLP